MSQKVPVILGIESSCDDTSAAIIKNNTILSNFIAGQEVHRKYGGVVPELASRAHMQNILPVVDSALKDAGVQLSHLDAIAFTKGPGLMGSLVVGTSFAKSLALALDIPLVDVNHMHGHILAHFIEDASDSKPEFPFLCMTVSGGHTQLVIVKDYLDMEIVGTTLDDAAGEAFDKAAKMLGFAYPGGPFIDKFGKDGNPKRFTFTKPKVDGYNFSFSGLKTAILYFLQAEEKKDPNFVQNNIADLCASIQYTIVTILMKQLKRVAKDYKITDVAIAGGVSANSGLREALEASGKQLGWNTFIPKFEYCTDNAAMIAIAGRYLFEKGILADQSIVAQPRVPFTR